MIVVCLHASAVRAAEDRSWQPSLPPHTGCQALSGSSVSRVNPVAFLPTDMSDSLYAHRRVGKQRDRRQGQRLIGKIVHIDCDARSAPSAGPVTRTPSGVSSAVHPMCSNTSRKRRSPCVCCPYAHAAQAPVRRSQPQPHKNSRQPTYPVPPYKSLSGRNFCTAPRSLFRQSDTHAEFLHHLPRDADV